MHAATRKSVALVRCTSATAAACEALRAALSTASIRVQRHAQLPPVKALSLPKQHRGMAFELQGTDGQARVGALTTARGLLETPSLLVTTRNGSLISVDNGALEAWSEQHGLLAVAVSAMQLCDAQLP